MSDFNKFATQIRAKFQAMQKMGQLFQVSADKDAIWEYYLDSFPEGSNPIFRERTEHDCNCCKNFVRNVGNVVVITEEGKLESVWGAVGIDYPYNEVATKMNALVTSLAVDRPWFTKEKSFGREVSYENTGGTSITWNHFQADVPSNVQTDVAGKLIGEAKTHVQTLERALIEITPDAILTVRDLVRDNNLYRGDVWKQQLKELYVMQAYFLSLDEPQDRNIFLWQYHKKQVAVIRNTSIGTLLVDLSEGRDLESAVAAYENKVSGTNYKRPKSLITPAMVTKAMDTIKELDIETAMQRRMANSGDITKNNVLWSQGGMTDTSKSALEKALLSQTKATAKASANNIGIELNKFLSEVVPTASAMEILFKGDLIQNMMTMTAPVHEDANLPFKWNNGIAWAYNGNVADSVIRDRVKAAGGCVDAALRISLAWSNGDDLDLHVHTPKNAHVFFGNTSADFGKLDVDAHRGGIHRAPNKVVTPVENIVFSKLSDGVYRVTIDQYRRMESIDQGFTVEVEANGQTMQYSKKGNNTVNNMLEIHINKGQISQIKTSAGVEGNPMTAEVWGKKTNEFVPVQSIVRSPNYWDGQAIGNQHFFFLVPGLKNDEPVRGIFNEFLKPELDIHRKVFEILGDKTKCEPTDDQLSGFGFSTTKPNSFVVRVTTEQGKKEYTVKV